MNTSQNNTEKDRFAPDKLLAMFKKTRFMNYLVMAIVIHIVVISGLSVKYLMDKAFPSRVVAREKIEKDRLDAEKNAEEAKRAAAKAAASTNNAAAVSNTAVTATAGSNAVPVSTGAPADKTNNPITKELNETAKPSELPKADDLGISITDTNPR